MFLFLEKFCENVTGKVTMYEFDEIDDKVILKKQLGNIEQNNGSKKKFHMSEHTDRASLLMQFFVLFSRNFKACSRNRVNHQLFRKKKYIQIDYIIKFPFFYFY